MKNVKIAGITIWRILAYFIIYSVIGYVIETTYAIVLYGVVESRQSFLYGPFCSIYGVGAVVMICALQRFKDKTHRLFLGGFVVGSITEYVVSFVGEKMLNTRWWDYSDKFLNLNGRISLIYSIFWGLLGLYLLKVVNPKIDKFIDWLKVKLKNIKALKIIDLAIIVLLFINCVVSGYALDCYLTRITVENDLDVENKEAVIEKYNYLYKEDEKRANRIYKFWGNEVMVKAYPNVTIRLSNGENVLAKTYSPDIAPYFYKFKREN